MNLNELEVTVTYQDGQTIRQPFREFALNCEDDAMLIRLLDGQVEHVITKNAVYSIVIESAHPRPTILEAIDQEIADTARAMASLTRLRRLVVGTPMAAGANA